MITTALQKIMENSSSNYSSGNTITSYIGNVRTMNDTTAYQYLSRLKDFQGFIENKYGFSIDELVPEIKQGQRDVYDVLNSYAAHLNSSNSISRLTLKQRVVTVKNFFEYYDIEISDRRFKLKVKLPKIIRKKKEALSKELIIEILNVCDNIRLRTYLTVCVFLIKPCLSTFTR